VPDFSDPRTRARFAGKRVAIAGSGHSALTVLVGPAELAEIVSVFRCSRDLIQCLANSFDRFVSLDQIGLTCRSW
jgi:cation diffusion facilitator CzcD-associated flavoprotein CzcO